MLFFQTELETGACAITGFKYSIDELDFAFVIDVMHLLCEQLEMLPLHGTWLWGAGQRLSPSENQPWKNGQIHQSDPEEPDLNRGNLDKWPKMAKYINLIWQNPICTGWIFTGAEWQAAMNYCNSVYWMNIIRINLNTKTWPSWKWAMHLSVLQSMAYPPLLMK